VISDAERFVKLVTRVQDINKTVEHLERTRNWLQQYKPRSPQIKSSFDEVIKFYQNELRSYQMLMRDLISKMARDKGGEVYG
jgi:hypothetical protein